MNAGRAALRLAERHGVKRTASTRLPASHHASKRALCISACRLEQQSQRPAQTTTPPHVGSPAIAQQIDMMTGEMTGQQDIDVRVSPDDWLLAGG